MRTWIRLEGDLILMHKEEVAVCICMQKFENHSEDILWGVQNAAHDYEQT